MKVRVLRNVLKDADYIDEVVGRIHCEMFSHRIGIAEVLVRHRLRHVNTTQLFKSTLIAAHQWEVEYVEERGVHGKYVQFVVPLVAFGIFQRMSLSREPGGKQRC